MNELEVLQYWKANNCFQKSLTLNQKEFTFYDGPPFCSGEIPHHGHIVASTIKDVIGRYRTQTGYRVKRIFGFDCHGVPVESEVNRQLGIKSKQEMDAIGLANYNQQCRDNVVKCEKSWLKAIERIGRWFDTDNVYKTMDLGYMESSWNVWKSLNTKGLVYYDFKIQPLSTVCGVMSSHESESALQEVKDYSLMLKLRSVTGEYLLVWTTTPWSLPANLCLCVNPDLNYCYVQADQEIYIVVEQRVKQYFPEPSILKVVKGVELTSLQYHNIYQNKLNPIVADSYVTADVGSGIVHIAPTYGVDDYRVALENKFFTTLPLQLLNLIDDSGKFQDVVTNLKELNQVETSPFLDSLNGKYFKDMEKEIVINLKTEGKVFACSKDFSHKYPFCPRSGTPLIYKAVGSWFINVNKIRAQLIDNVKQSNWVPAEVRDGRFMGLLNQKVDWCVSRMRSWGTPIPIWQSDDKSETLHIGSIKELQQLSGCGEINDIHREFIDDITIVSSTGKVLRRIPDIFDCWFESGSMPYGKDHYIEGDQIPLVADFIAEGIDQTRGWFYTLMVLSTALFDRPAFRNVIVNGIVKADDGKKMSKSLNNYVNPAVIVDKYGADSLRLYLLSTNISRADDLKFNESELVTIGVKNILIPLKNVVSLLKQTLDVYFQTKGYRFVANYQLDQVGILDKMLQDATTQFMTQVQSDLEQYKLYNLVGYITDFIDTLSRWYINLNKQELKDLSQVSLSVLSQSLYHFIVTTAPIIPFITESIYQELKYLFPVKIDSVHHIQMTNMIEQELVKDDSIEMMKKIIDLGRYIRSSSGISFKMPLVKVIVISPKLSNVKVFQEVIIDALNTLDLVFDTDCSKYVTESYSLNMKSCGKKFGNKLKGLPITKVDGVIMAGPHQLELQDVIVTYSPKQDFETASREDLTIMIDSTVTEEIEMIYQTKLVVRAIQNYRKKIKLQPVDQINLYHTGANQYCDKVSEILGYPVQAYSIDKEVDHLFGVDELPDISLYIKVVKINH